LTLSRNNKHEYESVSAYSAILNLEADYLYRKKIRQQARDNIPK